MSTKSVKQQLSELLGNKKSNVFYKGLDTDTDEHVFANDRFIDANNIRINNQNSGLGSAQSIKSNVLASTLTTTGVLFNPTDVTTEMVGSPSGVAGLNADRFWLEGGHSYNTTDNKIQKVKWTFTYVGGITFSHEVIIGSGKAIFGNVTSQSMVGVNKISNDTFIKYCYDSMTSSETFTNAITPVLIITEEGQSSNLLFTSKTTLVLSNITLSVLSEGASPSGEYNAVSNISAPIGVENEKFSDYNFNVSTSTSTHFPLSLVSFTGYIIAICYVSDNLNSILKLNVDGGNLVSSITPIVFSNFGLQNQFSSIRAQKVEENENYNRIYWTDGVNPIKTININATSNVYATFTGPDDFNLFSKSPLRPPVIRSVEDAGNVNCGSWSYCYRLISIDGKQSVISPISNPVPLGASSKNFIYKDYVGGSISTSSGKSVTLRISDIGQVYNSIQLIGIQYLNNDGGAAFFLLKDEKISGTTINLTHNGNESVTVITAGELFTKKNTFDIAQDIAIKDNRLLAANLKNSSSEVVSDNTTFRVKTFKHTGASGLSNFDTAPDGTSTNAYVADTEIHSSSLYEPELYKITPANETLFRYAEGKTSDAKLIFGASTPGYHSTTTDLNGDTVNADINGVYVSFKLKKFSLEKTSFWQKISEDDANFPQDSTDDGYTEPPYYGLNSKSGEDSHFDNYKNSIFAQKYVGYMRDEIYRFGIQFYDKDGNQTFTYPIGDIRFPAIENDYRFIGTTINSYTPTAGDGSSNPRKYILADSNGDGYILYPEFRIKLTDSVKRKISGFSIVRAERNDEDRRVVTAGLLNNTLSYRDHIENGTLKNKTGLDKQNLFTQVTGATNFDSSETTELYTLDSPDAIFGDFSYTKTGTESLKIASKFLCYSYSSSEKPDGGSDDHLHLGNSSSDVVWMRDNSTNTTFYAAPLAFDYTTSPDISVREMSFYSKYYCNDDVSTGLSLHTSDASKYTKAIHYGQNIAPGGVIPNSLHTHTQDFLNTSMVYGGSSGSSVHIDLNALVTTSNLISHSTGKANDGNTTIFLSLSDSLHFDMSDSSLDLDTPLVEGSHYAACKPYGKIIRTLTSSSGQYGGSSLVNFEQTRWISTGASVHGSDISSNTGQEMIVSVFGGDTYINMFSLNKFHRTTFNNDSKFRIVQGVVFPVESSINIDLRQGTFFGKNRANLQSEDEYIYNKSYSAGNTLKSFPAKDSNVKLVSDFKSQIAISNTKIGGQTEDAFSKFDSNESFEVNPNYGEIKNIVLFRDNIYSLQERATSILSINSRALIQSQNNADISIQSSVGTGNVIERNDYISISYGSQHRMNCLSTDRGLYWYDNYNNSICKISDVNPKQVLDLTTLKLCTKFLSNLKLVKLKDQPLFIINQTINTNGGGINISYNPFLNEILFSFNYFELTTPGLNATDVSNYSIKSMTLAFDETLDVFIGKRDYTTLINTHHEGYLYSVGVKSISESNLNKVYVHDGIEHATLPYNNFYENTVHPSITFVNNEEVSALKVFDKLSLMSTDTATTPLISEIFDSFVYNTNHNGTILDVSSTPIDKVVAGKHIIPITNIDGKRIKGNFLKTQIVQNKDSETKQFKLFSATTYYRKNII
jgi:hypothetical protein